MTREIPALIELQSTGKTDIKHMITNTGNTMKEIQCIIGTYNGETGPSLRV